MNKLVEFQKCILGQLKMFPNSPFMKFNLKGPNTADTFTATSCFVLAKLGMHKGMIAMDQNMNILVL